MDIARLGARSPVKIHRAVAITLSVTQPMVPEWKCASTWPRGRGRSVKTFQIPSPMVARNKTPEPTYSHRILVLVCGSRTGRSDRSFAANRASPPGGLRFAAMSLLALTVGYGCAISGCTVGNFAVWFLRS